MPYLTGRGRSVKGATSEGGDDKVSEKGVKLSHKKTFGNKCCSLPSGGGTCDLNSDCYGHNADCVLSNGKDRWCYPE